MNDEQFTEFVEKTRQHQQDSVQHMATHGSYGNRLVAGAAIRATEWAKQDGLHPRWDAEAREWRYKVRQGLRAACVGREDAAATLVLMSTVLDNQRTIKQLLVLAVALLGYIAYRLT